MTENKQNSSNNELEIKDLFSSDRLTGGILAKYCLFLYFPVGILLAILRLFIGIHALCVWFLFHRWYQARNLILKIFSLTLGLLIIEEHDSNEKHPGSADLLSKTAKLLVSNHVSCLDFFVINLIRPCFGFNDGKSPKLFSRLFETDDLSNTNVPILIFPEKYCTNGRVALLKFDQSSQSLFKADQFVQLIGISVERPVFIFRQITVTTISNNYFIDLFWFLFVPLNIFRVKFLDICEMSRDETGQQFADRMQILLADRLKIQTTNFTRHDVIEHLKNLKRRENRRKSELENPESPVNKILQILPQIPVKIIEQELEKSGSVDLAVANLLKCDQKNSTTKNVMNWSNLSSFKDTFEQHKREAIRENLKKYLLRHQINK